MEQLDFVTKQKQPQKKLGFQPILWQKVVDKNKGFQYIKRPPKIIQKSTKAANAYKNYQNKKFPRLENQQRIAQQNWNNDTKTSGWFDQQLKIRIQKQKQIPVKQTKLHKQQNKQTKIVKQVKRPQIGFDNQIQNKNRANSGSNKKIRCVGQQDYTYERQKRMPPFKQSDSSEQYLNKKTRDFSHTEARDLKVKDKETIGQLIQKTVQNIKQHSLIPFLQKASHRLISIHSSSITQIIIDDVLQQTIQLLNKLQQAKQKQNRNKKKSQLLDQFSSTLKNYFDDAQQIQQRLHNQYKLQKGFTVNPYVSLRQISKLVRQQQFLCMQPLQDNLLLLSIQQSLIKNQLNYKERFVRNLNKQLYGQKLQNIQFYIQQIQRQIFQQIVQQIDRGSDQMVEMLFRNQFK